MKRSVRRSPSGLLNPSDPMETAIFERATAPASPGPTTVDVPGSVSPMAHRVSVAEEGSPGPGEAFVALQHSRLRAAAGSWRP